ncbi:hypothetical protein SAMN04488004_11679 [Loktanella salsilacus]|uniref:AsnC family protein n=1 Tax=Loktanella salsilacus TaxID=195913 RepID=A0A1I4H8U6_9RHOB|nr:hypothetical protein [Loktanella salsilacus]SFL38719.1 hypothetical protein SAMN04488004_11679 [Loktanella salsilacus]
MADTYFISFVIREDATYSERYEGLMEDLRALSPTIWWSETTSFIILQSDLSIDYIVGIVEQHIDAKKDIAVIGKTEYKTMRVCGAYEDEDIFNLVPFAKKA